jgi:hypothetical protein
MPFDEGQLERFAMQAAQISQRLSSVGGYIEINPVGEQLGLSHQDALQLALFLESRDWAKVTMQPMNPQLILTPLGFKEIAKLRWPKWKRWLVPRFPWLVSTLIGLTALIIAIISLLTRK